MTFNKFNSTSEMYHLVAELFCSD